MFENLFWLKLDDFFHKYGQENVWFQQDNATAHITRHLLGILREMFPRHIFSLRNDLGGRRI